MFGRYRVVRVLGEGTSGTVYEARHEDLGRRVALKVLRAEHLSSTNAVQRFLREGQATSRLHHPHAVGVYDLGSANGAAWLVMELLEGENLGQRLERRGRLSTAETVDILLPVISAVDAAHAQGIVHRDLKPSNIVLAVGPFGEEQPKVVDFGISKLLHDGPMMTGDLGGELTGQAAILGTPMYMPPEQVRGARDANAFSDQYALGVILYRCVTGTPPFQGRDLFETMTAILAGQYPRPRSLEPGLRVEFEAIISRSMRVNPAERFPSLRAFAAALLPFASPAARAAWAPRFARADRLTPSGPRPALSASVEAAETDSRRTGRLSGTRTTRRRIDTRPAAPIVREARDAITIATVIVAAALLLIGAIWWAQRPRVSPRALQAAHPARALQS